jgi:mono/diheme cytochrome c family protein
MIRLPALLLAAALTLPGFALWAGETVQLEGNPFRGRELLSEKLCTQCHAVWGHGGAVGPEMTSAVAGKSWMDLVGDFWNHTPRMIEAVTDRGYSWPTLDRGEMADLLSYLYYMRLFDEPGDATRGALVYSRSACGNCHGLGEEAGPRAVSLDRFAAYPSPLMLAQAMWNAGPAMRRDQIALGVEIPKFQQTEMADIQAHIRRNGKRSGRAVELLAVPDPKKGAEVFAAKGCGVCHQKRGGEGPDLHAMAPGRTVAEISGILWNHGYAMSHRMAARGIPFPRFQGSEMADLIAYLYFLTFTVEEGDRTRGQALFEQSRCADCHQAKGGKAVELASSKAAEDAVALATAMWNHAPEMHRLMGEQAVAWPTMERGEMRNLAAYLRSIASAGGAAKEGKAR